MSLLHLSTLLLLAAAAADESFTGSGTFACYGDMTITFDKAVETVEAGPIDGAGVIDCVPAWGSAAAPPQGIIADGDDGSHWVTVDDKGFGDCTGTFWFEQGDLGLGYCDRVTTLDDGHQTRKFCGYASCEGYLNIQCSMLSGCHGA